MNYIKEILSINYIKRRKNYFEIKERKTPFIFTFANRKKINTYFVSALHVQFYFIQ